MKAQSIRFGVTATPVRLRPKVQDDGVGLTDDGRRMMIVAGLSWGRVKVTVGAGSWE